MPRWLLPRGRRPKFGSLVHSFFRTSHVLLTLSEHTPRGLFLFVPFTVCFSQRTCGPQPVARGQWRSELGGQEMDGVKLWRGVCDCVSNGEWGRMMLRVQPCGEWEEGRGLGPPQEQGREVVSGACQR